jgi:alkylation response protein AidB-like acyl-CoA dehydrogenase
MDFAVPAHLDEPLRQVRAFVREELYPLEGDFLNRRLGTLEAALAEKRRRVRELGLWAPHLPRELGGMGLALLEFALVSEELGRSPLGHYAFNCQAPDVGNMEILLRYGSDEQKTRWLWPLARGEIRSCFSMTEPDYPGSNPTWMGTTATRAGNDYVINGRKWFTTAAEGAAFAIVMAVTNPEAPSPHLRASQIIVPAGTPGFRIVRNVSVMGEVGAGYGTHAEVAYEDCRVPESNRLGPEGAGFVIAQERLGPGRIHHCMRWIGICERAFDLMCERAVRREVAPGRPLGTRQIVQAWIAEARAEIDAARLMVLRAAWEIDAVGAAAARDSISLIKFHVAGVLQQTLDRAIQAHGALGMTDDTPLAFFWRHERGARIYDGPDEVHKTAVARRILAARGMKDR